MRCFFISLGDRIVCDLKDRVYECKNCGAVIDRDLLTALQDCFNQNNLATSSVETGIRLKDYNY